MQTILRTGDYYDDGHGKYDTQLIEHNLESADALLRAFKEGTKKLGMDLTKYCESYEDSSIPAVFVHHLQHEGVLPTNLDDQSCVWPDDGEAHTYNMEGSDGYIDLWLRIARYGVPSLTYEVQNSTTPILELGGYGLF